MGREGYDGIRTCYNAGPRLSSTPAVASCLSLCSSLRSRACTRALTAWR